MRRIKFIKALGRREGQGAGPEYEKDKTYSFDGQIPEGYAQAYIDRGYAVEAEPEVRAKPAPLAPARPTSPPRAAAASSTAAPAATVPAIAPATNSSE